MCYYYDCFANLRNFRNKQKERKLISVNIDCGQIKEQSEESSCDRLKRTLHFGMKMTDEVKFIFCVEYNGLLTLLLLPVCLD